MRSLLAAGGLVADIVIVAVLAVLVGAALAYIIRQKKKGGVHCIGCPSAGSCSSCSGACSACNKSSTEK